MAEGSPAPCPALSPESPVKVWQPEVTLCCYSGSEKVKNLFQIDYSVGGESQALAGVTGLCVKGKVTM